MEIIKPGNFGQTIPADTRRQEFDFSNEQLICTNREIDLLFIGDSITHYWTQQAYFSSEKCIVNRGIGGDSTPYLLKRFDADVLQLKPKHIILLIGTNDILRVSPDYWWRRPGRPRDEIMAEVKENLEQLVKKAAGIPFTFCSILPMNICEPYDKTLLNDMVLELNAHIRSLCQTYGACYADYHSAMCDTDGKTLRDELAYDGIHPNAKGYEIMANVLKQFSDFT